MTALMKKCNGIGLAAPQVGMLQRIIIADVGEKPLCIVNPEIISRSGSDKMIEGCLSLPNIEVDITRNTTLEVKGKDVHGSYMDMEVSGLTARVIQHEIDHLNGILITDYDNPQSRYANDSPAAI
jgi:peptide deformylase